MTVPSEPSRLVRFDAVTRWVHWTNATAFLFLLTTGLVLSFGPLSALVGRREIVRNLHVVVGLFLPAPVVLGAIGRWGAVLRHDLARLNRWLADDRRWLRSLGRERGLRYGKFHPGQKLNAAFTAGSIPLMVLTGAIMRWNHRFPLPWRTGATFVHDWLATALLVVVAGHILKAVSDRDALGGMLSGEVTAAWADRHHPRWVSDQSTRR